MTVGRVVDTTDHSTSVSVRCRGLGEDRGEDVTVYLERCNEARSISPGDALRWEGRFAFWTPKGTPFTDWPLYRIGYGRVLMPRLKRECA